LGREMDPASEFAGMTTSQQWEHKRLTAKALASAGADVDAGSFLSQVASVAMLEGWEQSEVVKLMDEIDDYLADNMRGDDLSDENVLAALMGLGRTDMILSVLGTMETDQMQALIETLDGGTGTTTVAAGTGTSQMGAPTSGADDLGPEETAGALSPQDAFDANVREVATSTGRPFNEVYTNLYGEADESVRRNLREPDEGWDWGVVPDAAKAAAGWAFKGGNIRIGSTQYPSKAWELMPEGWGTEGPMTGASRSEKELITAWLNNKLKTHKWTMAAGGMRWERK